MHFRLHTGYFLLPLKIPKEISRQSMLFHNLREYLLYQMYVHTTFYHSSGLIRNWMFNECIYYVLYLHILRLYVVGQKGQGTLSMKLWNDAFYLAITLLVYGKNGTSVSPLVFIKGSLCHVWSGWLFLEAPAIMFVPVFISMKKAVSLPHKVKTQYVQR